MSKTYQEVKAKVDALTAAGRHAEAAALNGKLIQMSQGAVYCGKLED